MKNINLIAAAILTILSFTACNDKLDLLPSQSLDESVALNSDKNVKTVLNGVYNAMSSDGFLGADVLRNAELQGGDGEVVWVGTYQGPREIFNKQMNASNNDAEAMWVAGYNTVNVANNVLSALSVVNEDDRGWVEGEARFLRALAYFELVRSFAQPFEANGGNDQPGVPLVLEPTREVGEVQQVSRNAVNEVYQQVIADLTAAAGLLPGDNEWRASKAAATGLLARVYLQMGDHAKARDAADAVIGMNSHQLMANYADVFNRSSNSSEDIFVTQVSAQDGTNSMNIFFSIPDFGGRDGDIEILPAHLALYAPDDTRLALFFDYSGAARSGKWNTQYGNITLMRLAEMYLIRAECNARLGTAAGAAPLDDYNAVHTRAGLSAANSVTVDEILLERRRELAHEGFKIHDMKRLKLDVGSLKYNDPKLVFPIPLREMEANSNLVQNEGY
ncbi:MAG: RagB/SusD family nutrient uptake outer membrane protein [Saprospiraceae bacterium]|nr:RagB/SusD family nutrient uptake outer membrane protein [Saprospiraceae bacterium]MCF8249094.1 RagB/SusD family nutrient uptake outer membrane protein [Saprospiraceae bacterium]MCF8282899.1 RagB/SusD family nutrient uptake outer membrane protein [Bacteroidales bacterium]MCF8311116.1 RagB/SusD family nutrient uptake outer membrane protein [Saprospiraceae bacterium]MCF8440206.1 RagB/SusD family nutrient uptake outer membrane protein [Saprospiraceae bacterium]